RLAETIAAWRQRDSLVVGLYGPWGSGKSSVKNMVREMLEQGSIGPQRIVQYNPWQWAGQDELAQGFFSEIAVALGRSDSSKEGRKRAATWRLYSTYLHVGAVVAGGIRSGLIGILAFLGIIGIASWT